MELLTEQLTIANATIEEWTHRRTKKDGLKINFTVSAPLPRILAEQLRCAGIYENDTTRIDLSHKIKDAGLVVPIPGVEGGFSEFFPEVLYAFKAKRDEQQFTVEFACHVTVRAEELHEIFKGSPDVFEISLRPRQGQLFEGGTRVDVTPTSELLSRVVTNLSADEQKVADDILAGVNEHPDEAPIAAAPLASAVAMGVGTHQKRAARKDRTTVN